MTTPLTPFIANMPLKARCVYVCMCVFKCMYVCVCVCAFETTSAQIHKYSCICSKNVAHKYICVYKTGRNPLAASAAANKNNYVIVKCLRNYFPTVFTK